MIFLRYDTLQPCSNEHANWSASDPLKTIGLLNQIRESLQSGYEWSHSMIKQERLIPYFNISRDL